ncbi:MAG: hypothetical protein C5B59_08035 [Bacteroidetes bacterium]|nr:MAG: hypothetical protein C5B59_08035 [Bacteroidota bacterium]
MLPKSFYFYPAAKNTLYPERKNISECEIIPILQVQLPSLALHSDILKQQSFMDYHGAFFMPNSQGQLQATGQWPLPEPRTRC